MFCMILSATWAPFAKRKAVEGGGNRLVLTAARAEEIAEFAVLAAEAVGGIVALEAAHTADPTLDATMVPLEPVVQLCAGAMPNLLALHAADRPRVGAVPIRGHPVETQAHDRSG